MTSGSVFILGGGAIVWRSIKHTCIATSIIESEYGVASVASMEAVCLCKLLSALKVILEMDRLFILYFDNMATITNTKDSRDHKWIKHTNRKYHIIRSFERHIETMGCEICHIYLPMASGRLVGFVP